MKSKTRILTSAALIAALATTANAGNISACTTSGTSVTCSGVTILGDVDATAATGKSSANTLTMTNSFVSPAAPYEINKTYENITGFRINGTTYKNVTGIYQDKNGNYYQTDSANVSHLLGSNVEILRETITITINVSEAGNIYGGWGNASNNNVVNITASTLGASEGTVYGAVATSSGASGNSVNARDIATNTTYFGGYALNSAASGNAARLTNVSVLGAYGGMSESYAANNNYLSLNASNFTGQIAAGAGGYASNNSAVIEGGTGTEATIIGGTSSGTSSGNIVRVTGATFAGRVSQAATYDKTTKKWSWNNAAATGNSQIIGGSGTTASKNSVELTNIDATNSNLEIVGATSNGSAGGNVVKLANVTAAGGAVYGAIATQNANASDNRVEINGAINGFSAIYGGYIDEVTSDRTYVRDNVIAINAAVDLGTTKLVGGYAGATSQAAGNTLEVNAAGVKVASVENFENIKLNVSAASDQTPVLTLTTTNATDLSATNVVFAVSPNATQNILRVTPLASNGNVTTPKSIAVSNGTKTTTLTYTASLTDALVLDIRGVIKGGFYEEEKALLEGSVAGLLAAVRLGDLGFATADKVASAVRTSGVGGDFASAVAAFESATSKTGSEVAANVAHFNFAVARQGRGELYYGAFFEASVGGVETTNDIADKNIRGEGSIANYGGGLFVKKHFGERYASSVSVQARAGVSALSGFKLTTNGRSPAGAGEVELSRTYYGASVEVAHKFFFDGDDGASVDEKIAKIEQIRAGKFAGAGTSAVANLNLDGGAGANSNLGANAVSGASAAGATGTAAQNVAQAEPQTEEKKPTFGETLRGLFGFKKKDKMAATSAASTATAAQNSATQNSANSAAAQPYDDGLDEQTRATYRLLGIKIPTQNATSAKTSAQNAAKSAPNSNLTHAATNSATTATTTANSATPNSATHAKKPVKPREPNLNSVDIYARASYLQLGGADAQVAGINYEFDAAQSIRAQVGVRYNKWLSRTWEAQFALGYEHEFSGEADGTNADFGYAIGQAFDGAPSLKGGTAVAQVAFSYERDSVAVELRGGGFFGQTQGFMAGVNVKYKF